MTRTMTRLLRERLPFVLALVAASAVGPAAAMHFLLPEPATFSAGMHFWLALLSSGAAAGAAAWLTLVGARRQDAGTVLLGVAFSTMAALLMVHGLSTPGVLAGPNGVISFAGGASLPVGVVLLSLVALPGLRRPAAVGALLRLQLAVGIGIVTLAALGLLAPGVVPAVPRSGTAPAIVLMAVGLAFFLVLALRAARTFALTRRGTDLAVVVGTVWLGSALVPQLLLDPASMTFYLGHALELAGLALVAVPLGVDLSRTGASRTLAGDLSAADLVRAEEAFLGARVRALLIDLERKDASTEQHTRRVALRAVQVGEVLGLSPSRMRALAVGGLLHDIGKLGVPGAILGKPGALSDAEFAEIKRHPQAGHALLGDLGGFPEAVRRLVLDHHERLDGKGYPRGIGAAELDLETRVLTVCDVYDALVSDRVYRAAWPRPAALELLRDETNTAFDPRCVAALERVLEREAPDPPFVLELVPAPAPLRSATPAH